MSNQNGSSSRRGGGGGGGVERRQGNRHSASVLQPYMDSFNVDHDISMGQVHAGDARSTGSQGVSTLHADVSTVMKASVTPLELAFSKWSKQASNISSVLLT